MSLIIMKANKIILAITLLCFTLSGYSQKLDVNQVKVFAKEVYGESNIYQSDVDIAAYMDLLERVEIQELLAIPTYHKALSEDLLINKYNPNLSLDDASSFNMDTFNPLKYRFNYGADDDVYYQVSGTNYFIIIHPKK